MSQMIEIPVWLLVALLLLAILGFLDRMLVPSFRWFVRRRVDRVLEDVSQHLNIKIESFRLTKREVLIDRLLYDPEVMEAVEAHAAEHDMPREVVMSIVERYAREIVPAFNAYLYFRIGNWIARRVAQLLYRVRLGFADDQGLAAIDERSTVVFIMNHRSNMDYVLVAYLAASRTALSYAVGEWARIWPLQTLIRSMGAYFVRRRSRDPLYRRVLARYVHMATAAGVTQAVYPEGWLSRDGLIGEPKLGLLDYMLRSFEPNGDRDIVFVPVGINYDRVLEDRSLLLSLDDAPKTKSMTRAMVITLRFALRNFGQMLVGRWHRFGYVCANFGSPISMRHYCMERGVSPIELAREARFGFVEEVGDTLMAALGEVVPVVPVSVVSTVFVGATEPMTELELKSESLRLIESLEARGAHIYIPRRDREYAIQVGLRMLTLRHIVSELEGMYAAVPAERALLSYYANSICHLLPPGASGAAEPIGAGPGRSEDKAEGVQ
jgi:glycerol-3-phosphate O-acyltransferase